MNHSFNIDIAKDVGIASAVLLENIFFWCLKNKTNEKHYHEGRYWTYNSVSAFGEQFEYLSEYQIRTALNKLEESGYIVKGNFNNNKYNRTLWYAVTDKTIGAIKNSTLHAQKKQNGDIENQQCIYKDTDINTNINTDVEATAENIDYKKIHTYFNETTNGVFGNIIYPFSETRKGAIRARVKEYGIDAVIKVIDKANESDFLKGENDTKFKATFDWLMRPTYFPRTLEGNYDNNKKQKNKPINIKSYSDYD